MPLALGQPVVFDAALRNHHDPPGRATWTRHKCAETPGYFMGYRTVFDGVRISGNGYDDPSYFRPSRGIYHALVVTHPRRAPVRVPLDAIRAGCAQG